MGVWASSLTNLESSYLGTARPNCWHWFVVKESTGLAAQCPAKDAEKTIDSLMAFREGISKAGWGRGQPCAHQLGWSLGLVVIKARSEPQQSLLVSASLRSMCWRSAVSIWWGFASCKSVLGMRVRPLSVSFREQEVQCLCSVAGLSSQLLPIFWPNK